MGSICLSSASILRCDSLTRNQNIYLIIPTTLEVIFSISLVFIDWGPGKRNLLLTLEGLSFLALVVLELLVQILPAVREDLGLFKAFDLAIGISSFLPISLYTVFLYLLTNAEIVTALPHRIKNFIKLALAFFIPAIVIFNEIASFISVSIRNIPAGQAPETVFTIGFSSSTHQELWTFFTSLTLALLASFQFAAFCFAFIRLTLAILDQRRIESQRGDGAHLIKGIGWITGSLKLGAMETVVGFVGGGFGVVLTRRILRLLVRAFMCIGVAKGVDLVEDFRAVRNEPLLGGGDGKSRRRQLREFISNPRYSTFHQLSPKDTTFQKSATYKTAGLPDMVHFSNDKAQNGQRRVTVRYDAGTPSLHVRFSMLDIPSPATIADEIRARPQSEWDAHLSQPQPNFIQPLKSVFRGSADSATTFSGPFELVAAPRRMLSQRSARAQLYRAASSASRESPYSYSDPTAVEPRGVGRVQSVKSIPDSLQAVHDLAGQFPGPPTAFKDRNTLITPSVWNEVPTDALPKPQALGSPSALQFKEILSRKSEDSARSSNRSIGLSDKSILSNRQPTLYTVTETPSKSAAFYSEKPIDPFNDEDEEDSCSPSIVTSVDKETSDVPVSGFNGLQNPKGRTGDIPDLATALDTEESHRFQRSLQQKSPYRSGKVTQTADRICSSSKATELLPPAKIPTKPPQHSHERNISIGIPWLKTADLEEEDRRLLRAMSKRDIPVSRVKSVGKAPRRSTPQPTLASHARGSMHLNPIIIPPRARNMPGVMDDHEYGSLQSTESGEGICRDSEVFEMKDGIVEEERD